MKQRMKPNEARALPPEEIRAQIKKVQEQLFKFKFHASNEEMQRGGEIRHLRRRIALLETIERERALGLKKPSPA